MILELIWLLFVVLHTVPLAVYLFWMKSVSEKKPWNIEIGRSFEPSITVILPVYNESKTIARKLDNMLEVDYPKDKIDIIVVNSASTDGTGEIVNDWIKKHEHTSLRVNLIEESERSGMVKALNIGVKSATGEIVAKTDSDCLWFKDSLKEAVKYLVDPTVGSVASLHSISSHKETEAVKVEKTYRRFYSWLRIGESKLYSTVLYEGELMLVRRKLLAEIGNFDETLGADDVPTALRVTKHGYRAITSETAFFSELAPYSWKERFKQKVRRGRHVIQALWKFRALNFKHKTYFNSVILPMETYIYLIDPWLIVPVILLLPFVVVANPWILIFTLFLAANSIRELVFTHLTDICIMLVAMIKETRHREKIVWTKIEEIR
jgi:poly-beta-1,6-N-acetyl-D-glucosamine synthase